MKYNLETLLAFTEIQKGAVLNLQGCKYEIWIYDYKQNKIECIL